MFEAAIEELLDRHRYFAALNLAGVAQELYGTYVVHAGGLSAQQKEINEAEESASVVPPFLTEIKSRDYYC